MGKKWAEKYCKVSMPSINLFSDKSHLKPKRSQNKKQKNQHKGNDLQSVECVPSANSSF